jgi:hypothetical protein
VVAFGYCPVPVSLEGMLINAHKQSLRSNYESPESAAVDPSPSLNEETSVPFRGVKDRNVNSVHNFNGGGSYFSPTSVIRSQNVDLPQSNCLFFVDPSTELDLHLSAVSHHRMQTVEFSEFRRARPAANVEESKNADRDEESNVSPRHNRSEDHHHSSSRKSGKHHHTHKRAGAGSKPPIMVKSLSASYIEDSPEPRYGEIEMYDDDRVRDDSLSAVQAPVAERAGAGVDSRGMGDGSGRLRLPGLKEYGMNSTGSAGDGGFAGDRADEDLTLSPTSRLRRQRSSSFSGDFVTSPSESTPGARIIVDSDETDRGYQSDPGALISSRARLDDGMDESVHERASESVGSIELSPQMSGGTELNRAHSDQMTDGANARDDDVDSMTATASNAPRHQQAAPPSPSLRARRGASPSVLIPRSVSDSMLVTHTADGALSAIPLAETVFDIAASLLNASEDNKVADNSARRGSRGDVLIDSSLDNPGTRRSVQFQDGGREVAVIADDSIEGAAFDLGDGLAVDDETIVSGQSVTPGASSRNIPAISDDSSEMRSLESSLVQFTPAGPVYSETVSHLVLKRSTSLDMASMTLAAMETNSKLCDLNMAPLTTGTDERNSAGVDGIHDTVRLNDTGASCNDAASPRDTKGSDAATAEDSKPLSAEAIIRDAKYLGSSVWSFLHQQIFLGMAASSVPVKPEAPELMEDLQAAGIRFVYFSARNMRRSKRVAEKIGLQTDWNCAISLRGLEAEESADPHRFEWDIKARLPHGVEAIKEHLKVVDNVPLLVSLFTDSTPDTIRQMINIFRENGEVVMTVGSSFKELNQPLFSASDIGVPVATLPGEREISAHVKDVVSVFPRYGLRSLCQADMLLVFQLIGLGSVSLLQTFHGSGIIHEEHVQPRRRNSSKAEESNPANSEEKANLQSVPVEPSVIPH